MKINNRFSVENLENNGYNKNRFYFSFQRKNLHHLLLQSAEQALNLTLDR